jgi:hypothetical protein
MAVTAMVDKATGDIITEAEWDKIKAYFDAAFPLVGAGLDTAWTTWAPTYSNMTVGNGTTTYAKYMRIGRWIVFELRFTLGSTSAISTTPTFTLPVQASARYNDNSRDLIGEVLVFDSGTAGYRGSCMWRSSTTAGLLVMAASGTYVNHVDVASTVPMTWTTNDSFTVKGWYESLA